MPSDLARHWPLEAGTTFLNHGSFGSCPLPVLETQRELVLRLEAEPIRFLVRELEGRLDEARHELAAFVGADAQDVAFVRNATEGVNTVLRSARIEAGDELLVTDHEYNACRNALDRIAAERGASVVVASVPFPVASEDAVVDALVSRVTARTRLALVDHVTSPTALVLPAARIVAALRERGVDVLVDGAHAPGMIDLDVNALGATYYTGNCHKWVCAPKGAAFLHVSREHHATLRPLATSHGANSPRTDRSRFLVELDWIGTVDPTPWLCIPAALRFMEGLVTGGWPEIRRRNRALALEAQSILSDALGIGAPAPPSMIGSMAALPLPRSTEPLRSPLYMDSLQDALWERDRIEVPVNVWPAWPSRLLRVSAQLYNSTQQYEQLATALKREFGSR